MRQVKRRSPAPVYIAAAVFAAYALLLPLYKSWHFLVAALVTASAWLLADKLIKPTVEYVPEPEPEPVSYGPEADAVLAEAKKARTEMDRLAGCISDADVKAKIATLAELSDRIARTPSRTPPTSPRSKSSRATSSPPPSGFSTPMTG